MNPTHNQTTTMNDIESCTAACNKLLRGELAAIETYSQALEKFADDPESSTLEQILSEHEESAEVLREHLAQMGAVPDMDSGAWGSFAQAVEGTAELFGESAALTALIEGEQHGISEYEEALDDPDVMEEAKATIQDTLLPRLFEHVAVLEQLRAA
jgi:rubrerythrin